MKLKQILQTKLGTAIELLIYFIVALSTLQLGIIIPILVMIVIASMKIRKLKYIDIGFIKKDFKLNKICLGIATAVLYFLIINYFIDPLVSKFTTTELPEIFNIKGDIQKLIMGLLVSWTIAAFFEEIIFRAYLIRRLTNLMGESLAAKILIVLLAGTAFGFVHYYQGLHGIISAGIIGIFQSTIYFVNNKKLTIPIIAHGTYDSIGFVYLFLG